MNINDHIEKVLVTEEELTKRCKEIAEEISKEYEDKTPILICPLKGAVNFFSRICENITVPMIYDFIKASSYSGTQSLGTVNITYMPTTKLTNRHLIIVEDIIDTGLTARFLTDLFKIKHHPKKLLFVSLLNKKCARQIEIEPDLYGFEIDDKFVVGYGLDYKGYFRNLPYIGFFP